MQVSVYLTVDSTILSPTEMGARMGMMDECMFAGDKMLSGEPRASNRWEIAEQVKSEFSTVLVEAVLDRLLERLVGKEDTFAEIARLGQATLQIYVLSDGYPGLMFSPRQLSLLSRLGVTLDLDLHCDPKEAA
jgi:FMN phosphatase YigB (HAD superfamily)